MSRVSHGHWPVPNAKMRGLQWYVAGLLASMLLPLAAAQAAEAMVRAAIKPAETYWTGQQLTLQVDLLSDGLSFADQRFRIPPIEGAMVLESSVATIKLNERVRGGSWQVLRYEFPLFPQRPGPVAIAPIEVAFAVSQGYGSEPEAFELTTDAISFEVTQPPSVAADQAVVTSASASVSVNQTPAQGPFRVGDAVTRIVRREVAGVSAMFLAPVPKVALDGVTRYDKAPLVTDRSDRGALLGIREDRTTYVFEQSGLVTLPGFSQPWWDPQRERLSQLYVPSVTIDVAAMASPSPGAGQVPVPWWLVGLALVAATAVAWLTRRRRKRPIESGHESALFSTLLAACDSHNAKAAYNAYMAWRPAAMHGTAPASLLRALRDAQQALVFDHKWHGGALKAQLIAVRARTKPRAGEAASTRLQALNPDTTLAERNRLLHAASP